MQIDTGDDYPLLNPAYFIGILDFPFGEGDNYKTHHLMLEKETYEHLLKDIQFAFIQLPKFKLDIHELATPIDRWTYFIKHSTELSIIPEFAQADEGLNAAFIEADRHNWTKEEGKVDMIIGMHNEGFTIQQIAKVSKKLEDEITQIIENHKNR
jgi:hypothetical protein